ncbi:MAG: amidohydrolase [Clostridium sp.]|nr:amidohydrolase [Clostridium sp.]
MELLNYKSLVEKHREKILEVERYIWKHPETGFKEWNTTKYLAEIFEAAGYELTMAGDIPGFYTDIDTGRPGPKVLILGEMDALVAPSHPENVNGNAHACGHNAQCAALVGTALALKEPGALDGLCGSIRLMAVPAEELIEVEFRNQLRDQGIIHYLGGKVEYLYRGYMDGCDVAFMNHATTKTDYIFDCNDSNGCMAKEATYAGVAAHAGGSPHLGVNALYAATQGLNAINALRETFQDGEHVRVHPIMTAGGGSVNIIPAEAKISTFVRGATLESMVESNRKVNRALASGALALGATVKISDRPGYAPLLNDRGLMQVAEDVAVMLLGKDKVQMHRPWGCGSTDMGDLSCVMRALHPHISGASGKGHGDDYYITDPETCCVMGAAIQVTLAAALLENGAARAKEVLAGPALRYPNKEAYFEAMDQFMADRELVTYDGDKAVVEF